jgi:hypothetical protein
LAPWLKFFEMFVAALAVLGFARARQGDQDFRINGAGVE